MPSNIRLVKSGFSLIDENWGGVYAGGSYLLLGPRKSGRTLLALQFAKRAAESGSICLFFTNMRPKDLMIQAASIDFDLERSMNANNVIVVRVAHPTEAYESSHPDHYLSEYLKDIINLVGQYRPNLLIFDELTPYLGFKSLDALRGQFLRVLETVEEEDVTSLFLVGEPATARAKEIISTISGSVTGVISLKKGSEQFGSSPKVGTIEIVPNVGHTEGRFQSDYAIVPGRGVELFQESFPGSAVKTARETEAEQTDTKIEKDQYSFLNFYEYNDFVLILNNQIALYKSTGRIFKVLSFQLDPAASAKELLSIKQLQNSLRTLFGKKDKLCAIDNIVIVLLLNEDEAKPEALIEGLRDCLPSKDKKCQDSMMEYISVLRVEISDQINAAEDVMSFLQSSLSSGSYRQLNEITVSNRYNI